MADITDPIVLKFVTHNRGLAQQLTVLSPACNSRVLKGTEVIVPLIAANDPADVIAENRTGIPNLTKQDAVDFHVLLGKIVQVLKGEATTVAARSVPELLERLCVVDFEYRRIDSVATMFEDD